MQKCPSRSSFLENQVFDHRLVKENLLDTRLTESHLYDDREDYRAFKATYVCI